MDGKSIDTEMKNAVMAADKEAQYDEKAKRLLGNKYILAHILARTVDEFKGMNPTDIVSHIEGEPFISMIPVEPGLTNAEREESGQMIINVEAQKDAPAEYKILNRAIFYVSRLISSQKERDFAGNSYDDIKSVFSIWICMNMSENSMNYIHLTNDVLLGSYKWDGKMDLLNIVLIGLSNELPERDEKNELHRLLAALLSIELSVDERLDILEMEYDIPIENNMRKDVSVMCNLSLGILERGRAEGEARGETRIIANMYKNGFTVEQIASATDKSVEEVKAIIENSESM